MAARILLRRCSPDAPGLVPGARVVVLAEPSLRWCGRAHRAAELNG